MTKFTVEKTLRLIVEVEAKTPREAYEQMLEMDDNTFEVVECDYELYADGDFVDPENYER